MNPIERRLGRVEGKIGPPIRQMIVIEQKSHETYEDAKTRYEEENGPIPSDNVQILNVVFIASKHVTRPRQD
jgi:hypothetical protein